jgi:hypothetical protein
LMNAHLACSPWRANQSTLGFEMAIKSPNRTVLTTLNHIYDVDFKGFC